MIHPFSHFTITSTTALKSVATMCITMILGALSQGCGPNGLFPNSSQTRAQQLQRLQLDYTIGVTAVNTALAIGQADPETVQSAQVIMDAVELAITKAQTDLQTNPTELVWQADLNAINAGLVKLSPLFQKTKSTRTASAPSPVTSPSP